MLSEESFEHVVLIDFGCSSVTIPSSFNPHRFAFVGRNTFDLKQTHQFLNNKITNLKLALFVDSCH